MIFVTVGTHEQQFDRLIKAVDVLKKNGQINEDVFIQKGYSKYKPKYCEWRDFVTYSEMKEYICEARIIITHGGPASFIMPLQVGKIPIVVPRRKKYGEHVNNHQAEFTKMVEKRMKNIICVEKIKELGIIINDYDNIIKNVNNKIASNNVAFCKEFQKIIDGLME